MATEPGGPVALLPSSGMGVYELWAGLYQSGVPETAEDWNTVWGLVDVVVSLGSLTERGGPGPAPSVVAPSGKVAISWNIEDGPLPSEDFLLGLAELVATWISDRRSVLIHCGAGVNRSSLLSALVVRHLTGESGRVCAGHIRARKPGTLVNGAFNDYLNDLPELEVEEFPELEEQDIEIPRLPAGTASEEDENPPQADG